MISLQEYDAQMEKFVDELMEYKVDMEAWEEKVSEYQLDYMMDVFEEYKKTIKGNMAKEIIAELLHYAITESNSGNAIVYFEEDDLANEVRDIIQDEIGHYLLDYEIYKDELSDEWAVDVMFAGYYIPYWDGWKKKENMQRLKYKL